MRTHFHNSRIQEVMWEGRGFMADDGRNGKKSYIYNFKPAPHLTFSSLCLRKR